MLNMRYKLPPKFHGLPFIGTSLHLSKKKLDFLLEARERYGDIFRIQLGNTDITVLGHPKHAQHVLYNNADNYHRDKGSHGLRIAPLPLMKNGLATSSGKTKDAQQQRGLIEIIQPYLNKKHISMFCKLMVDTIEKDIVRWETTSKNPLDVDEALTRTTMNIIGKIRSYLA
jgi:cytochrome P450